jgi:hypothetical protein
MGDELKPQIGKDLVTLAQASRHLAEAHLSEKDWSGIPVPIIGLQLVLEPRYKHKRLEEFRWSECYTEDGVRHEIPKEEPPEPSEFTRANSWWNDKYQATIVVLHDKGGRARVRFSPENRFSFTMRTLEAASAWPIDAEEKAMKKLADLIAPESYELYVLTGHFAETSKRSQVTYIFRKGRPTVALREYEDFTNILCALCLHPIGYYGDTWAGVMCPTDEVIAHLLMMRGSEEKYWANANQHSPDRPQAGI